MSGGGLHQIPLAKRDRMGYNGGNTRKRGRQMKREKITKLFSHMPSIHTERLILRPMRVSDAQDMYRYARREDVTTYLLWSPYPSLDFAKQYLRYGASPRAGQALMTAAKIRALINGNFNVSYEDIDALAFPVLRHRVKVNYNAINDHLTVEDVIKLLIKENKKLAK